MTSGRRAWAGMVAALTALLLLGYASVQSTLMQAVMACAASPAGPSAAAGTPRVAMGEMPGMAMAAASPSAVKSKSVGAPPGRSPLKPGPAKSNPAKPCPFCSAAAHAPIPGLAPPLRLPIAVAFSVFLIAIARGPRGPPERQPRARGPPVSSL